MPSIQRNGVALKVRKKNRFCISYAYITYAPIKFKSHSAPSHIFFLPEPIKNYFIVKP